MKNRITAFLICFSTILLAQQKMTLADCEDAFVKNNLQLLAQQYNISASDADVVQAKIWDLPVAGFSANMIDPQNNKIFNVGQSKSVTLQQLFRLGGKRELQAEYARKNKELAKFQYAQLLTDLKAQLRKTFYSLYYDQKKVESINQQIDFLEDLLKAYKIQTAKGNISLKDQVRIQSLVLSLNNDKIQITNQITVEQQDLMTLSGVTESILPEFSDTEAQNLLEQQASYTLEELKKYALENNSELQFYEKSVEAGKAYYNLQKSFNVPDLNAGLQWNQTSGLYKNEINFSVNIPIPLWKQNQGNVEKAKIIVDQNATVSQYKRVALGNQVEAAFKNWQNMKNQFSSISNQDLKDLDFVYHGMLTNFRRGNVNLIEFTDFSESYKQNILQINEIKKQILIAAEELNRLTQINIQ